MYEEELLPGPPKRPTIITVFAILSLVWVGFSFFSMLLGGVIGSGGDVSAEAMEAPMWENMLNVLLMMGKGIGAILILKMRKIGVYLYTITEVTISLVGILALNRIVDFMRESPEMDDLPFDMGMVYVVTFALLGVFSIVWIAVYFSQINKMT